MPGVCSCEGQSQKIYINFEDETVILVVGLNTKVSEVRHAFAQEVDIPVENLEFKHRGTNLEDKDSIVQFDSLASPIMAFDKKAIPKVVVPPPEKPLETVSKPTVTPLLEPPTSIPVTTESQRPLPSHSSPQIVPGTLRTQLSSQSPNMGPVDRNSKTNLPPMQPNNDGRPPSTRIVNSPPIPPKINDSTNKSIPPPLSINGDDKQTNDNKPKTIKAKTTKESKVNNSAGKNEDQSAPKKKKVVKNSRPETTTEQITTTTTTTTTTTLTNESGPAKKKVKAKSNEGNIQGGNVASNDVEIKKENKVVKKKAAGTTDGVAVTAPTSGSAPAEPPGTKKVVKKKAAGSTDGVAVTAPTSGSVPAEPSGTKKVVKKKAIDSDGGSAAKKKTDNVSITAN